MHRGDGCGVVGSFIEGKGIEDDGVQGTGARGCIPMCVPTPSLARRRDRRLEYRLTIVFVKDSTSLRSSPIFSATTFGILRSFVHVSRSPASRVLRVLRQYLRPATFRRYYHLLLQPPWCIHPPLHIFIYVGRLGVISDCYFYLIKSIVGFCYARNKSNRESSLPRKRCNYIILCLYIIN